MFDSVKQDNPMDGMKHFASLLLSLFLHATAISVVLLLPLIFMNTIQSGELQAYVFAPEPPAPPPAPVPPAIAASSRAAASGTVQIAEFKPPDAMPVGIPAPDAEMPEVRGSGIGVFEGVPSGTPGEGVAAAIAAIVNPALPKLPDPLPPIRRPQGEAVKMGGRILEARLIHKVSPVYPLIAQKVRVSGPVELAATIDEEGNVTDLHVISGHVLLREAAVEAVRQWKYRPLFLNGEPAPILASIRVVFNLR